MRAYTVGLWRGVPNYQCSSCPYCVLADEGSMIKHARYRHQDVGFILSGAPVEEAVNAQGRLDGVSLLVGTLSWNNGPAVVSESLQAIADECKRLASVGARADFMAVDNGSKDGSVAAMGEVVLKERSGYVLVNSSNVGNSIARNQIIRQALGTGVDFLALIDADIEVVPWSLYAMIHYMLKSSVGCLGANSASCTNVRGDADKECAYIPPSFVKSGVRCAWTQYGVFDASMFLGGVSFEEGGPFGGPGWGFEDVDLYVQMALVKYRCEHFDGMTYLHRDRNSSICLLEGEGMDPQRIYDARRKFLVNKWVRVREAQFISSMDGRLPRKGYAGRKDSPKVGVRDQVAAQR